MTAQWVDLTNEAGQPLNARVLVHPRTGRDSMLTLSIRVRMSSFIEQYDVPGAWKYQDDFGYCLCQTEAIEGVPFTLPDVLSTTDGEALAAHFEDWLALPDEIVQAWRRALDAKVPINAPELLPAAKADVSTEAKKKGEKNS